MSHTSCWNGPIGENNIDMIKLVLKIVTLTVNIFKLKFFYTNIFARDQMFY